MYPDEKKVCACIPCKCTKFIPITTPRMNIHSVNQHVWKKDLKMYNEHRKKCFYAKPCVDATPFHIKIDDRIQPVTLLGDVYRAMKIDWENKNLLKHIVTIERLGGMIDTVNSRANMHISRMQGQIGNMLRIDKQNKEIYDRIKNAKSSYSYGAGDWKKWKKDLQRAARFPLIVFDRRNLDEEVKAQPSISSGLRKKPPHAECYMDFKVLHGEYLGRIVIELYHDFAPITVKNFLEICKGFTNGFYKLTYKNCPVHRIIKDQYLETGDITHGTGIGGCPVYGKPFKEEPHKLKHNKTGTLSMVREGKQTNTSKFCITFRPMEQLDKKNVVFGKVIHGTEVLMKINGYGRKIGRPLVNIIISDCGELPPCTCKRKRIKCK